MQIERIWSMPNKWTFNIPPIKKLLNEELKEGIWCDPFSGKNSIKEFSLLSGLLTNDINEAIESDYHLDALTFLRRIESNFVFGVLYDPPYSITQARMYGKKEFSSMKYWADCKNEIARIIKPGGKAICFGWNTMGLGNNRGFEMNRILLVPHGGSKNDTIVTVEEKPATASRLKLS